MNKIPSEDLKKGGEENTSDNVLSHLNNSALSCVMQAQSALSVFQSINEIERQPVLPPAKASENNILRLITPEEKQRKKQDKQEKTFSSLIPVPEDAPAFTKDTPTYHNKKFNGDPVAWYSYLMADGSLVGHMVRWHVRNPDGAPQLDQKGKQEKEVIPYIYVQNENGKRGWRGGGFPEPRPLYNLPDIVCRPQAPVLVVEGEKVVECLKPHLPDYVLVTSAHGAQSPHKSDWSVLKDRKVIICPDRDKAGVQYSDAVCLAIREAGALSIQSLSLDLLVKSLLKKESVPEGYDLADAVNDGLNLVLLNQSLERFLAPYLTSNERINQQFPDKAFQLNEQGNVEYYFERKNPKGEVIESEWKWLCGYLVVTHRTRDKDNQNWSKIAVLMDGDGLRKEVKITASLLAGDDKALKELLLSEGLSLNIHATSQLKSYLSQSNPRARRRMIDRLGWYKDIYVLPHKTYGTIENEDVVLQIEFRRSLYILKGTLAEWQQNIGHYLEGNTRLQVSVLIGLACPLLTPLDRENFGLHNFGHSSLGKSTSLHVSCSVYGSEFRSWRTTDNSAEAWGVSSNDNLLVLDDMGQASAETVAEMTYMLGNGQGKGRMNRTGSVRAVSKFNVCTYSSGETGIAAKLQEGRKKLNYHAGQAVRLMEIPADAGQGFGIFETLHDFEGGASFSKYLKEASKRYCGSLGDAWLTLLAEFQKEMLGLIKEAEQNFLKETPLEHKADGQVERAQANFALMAAAGEVAIQKGLLNWKERSAFKACQTLFNVWMNQRGGVESHEVIEFIKRVRNFLLEHGTMRFEMIGKKTRESFEARSTQQGDEPTKPRTKDRMGFSQEIAGKTTYYCFTDVFDKELVQQGDKNILLNALVKRGFLERDEKHFAKLKRLPGMERRRVYVLSLPEDL